MRPNQSARVLVVVLLVLTAGCGEITVGEDDVFSSVGPDGQDDGVPSGAVNGTLEVHHVDVGQADATLLVTPSGETILVDTGGWRDEGETVLAYLEALGVERIDHLVATHAHADHIGGHAAVIEHYETEADGVGAVYDSGVVHDTQTYERYLDAIEAHDVRLFEVREGDAMPLEDDQVGATFLNPPADDSESDMHYNSVVLRVTFGEFRYLTTGDAESDAERRLLQGDEDALDADVYQAGHHGSATSSSPAFLHAVDPDVAVISSDRDSQYGHPHEEVLERFAERGVETYWTGVHGDVVVRTDGENATVETEEDFSTDPRDLLEARGESTAERTGVARPLQVSAPRTAG